MGASLLALYAKFICVREGLDAAARSGFVDALYFSLGTQATLGYGDIVPTNPWLMMGATFQAFSGLGVLLAALAWYLAIG